MKIPFQKTPKIYICYAQIFICIVVQCLEEVYMPHNHVFKLNYDAIGLMWGHLEKLQAFKAVAQMQVAFVTMPNYLMRCSLFYFFVFKMVLLVGINIFVFYQLDLRKTDKQFGGN